MVYIRNLFCVRYRHIYQILYPEIPEGFPSRQAVSLNVDPPHSLHNPGKSCLWGVLPPDKETRRCDRSSGSWEHCCHWLDIPAHAGKKSWLGIHWDRKLSRTLFEEAMDPGRCPRLSPKRTAPTVAHHPSRRPILEHQLDFQRSCQLKPGLQDQPIRYILRK